MLEKLVKLAETSALCILVNAAFLEPIDAQKSPEVMPPGTVSGTVLDAGTGEPLAGAAVVLEPKPAGSLRTSGSGNFWSSGISVRTDDLGQYRFAEIAPGDYRLYIRRLGYHPATVDLGMKRARGFRVSIGLTVQPIRLEPAVGIAAVPATFNDSDPLSEDVSNQRVTTELYRQTRFLENDVRVITRGDVVEAATLAENDVFRALHRLPGVTTRDDFTAELWTRGASWSHTRVFYDGMPLFNPVHAAGVFSGINPDALGTAFFHPGTRSASKGEGAASVIDLTSRQWDRNDFGGTAGLSVASARVSLGGPVTDRGSWSLAMRRTYVDVLTGLVSGWAGRIPYAFLDLAGRADFQLGNNITVAASALWERDEVWGTVPDLLRENKGRWGNAAGQTTISAPFGQLHTTHTLGFSHYGGAIKTVQFVADSGLELAVPTHEPTENEIKYLTLRSRLEPIGATSASSWAVGYDLEFQRQQFIGPYPRPYPSVSLPRKLGQWAEQLRLALWGEKRFTVRNLTLQLGLRTEFGGGVANTTPVELAPRLSARLAMTSATAISAGYGRSHQYTQAVAPAGSGIGPDLHITDVWLMANDTIPAIKSDVATVGVESWLGEGWLGSATIYGRIATGVTVPDPSPGTLDPDRPIFWSATNRAVGFEFSIRRLTGPITTSLAYTHGISEMHAGEFSYPSTSARRHVFDATAMARLGRAVRLGAALTASSGARFTRVHLGPVVCASKDVVCPDTVFTATTIEDAGGAEAPAYVVLDLVADWIHTFRSWQLAVTVQLKNALNRQNAVTYVGTYSGCNQDSPMERVILPGVCDRFDRGLPLLPLVGVSARF
jgi:hypothetical protein